MHLGGNSVWDMPKINDAWGNFTSNSTKLSPLFFFGRISQTEPRFGGSVGRLVAMNFQLS